MVGLVRHGRNASNEFAGGESGKEVPDVSQLETRATWVCAQTAYKVLPADSARFVPRTSAPTSLASMNDASTRSTTMVVKASSSRSIATYLTIAPSWPNQLPPAASSTCTT
jgi:hypothetical protein